MIKKIALVILCLCLLQVNNCFATEELTDGEDGTQEPVYIDNYEDYENLINGSQEYGQDELKEEYEAYQEYMKGYFESYVREKTYKARIVEVNDVKEEYELDEYYYTINKYVIEPITVELLEGEHKGDKFEIDFMLTGDSMNNIQYAKLQKGDVIYVAVDVDDETGEKVAYITNAGANVERFGILVFMSVVTLVLLALYGGKKGILTGLIAIFIVDFCMVIIPNTGFAGNGFIFVGTIFIALLIAVIALMNFKISKKALKAWIISAGLTIVSLLLLIMANYLTRTVGVTFETGTLADNLILGNMSFEQLYILITLIITSVAVTKTVCKCMTIISKEKINNYSDGVKAFEGVLGSDVLGVVATLAALYIPTQILLLSCKYTVNEILNAEIFASVLIRIFVTVVTMTLTVPTVLMLNEKEEK